MKSFVLELTYKGEIVCNKHDEEHKKIENDLSPNCKQKLEIRR